jgi:hypothetical protein
MRLPQIGKERNEFRAVFHLLRPDVYLAAKIWTERYWDLDRTIGLLMVL